MTLPIDPASRKAVPVFSGCLAYFPRAIAAVAALSRDANEKHNPGENLHWARDKSADHRDALMRHLIDTVADSQAMSTEGHLHLVHVAWRALAAAELVLEEQAKANDAGAMRQAALDRACSADRHNPADSPAPDSLTGGFMPHYPATDTGD